MVRCMWSTFWADVVVAVIGALLTVLVAALTYGLNERRRETLSLRALIYDLGHRRALVVDVPREIPNALELDDYHRASASVLNMRDAIRQAVEGVRDSKKLQDILSQMTRACNTYLENSAASPSRYWYYLAELRDSLAESVRALKTVKKGLKVHEPGERAL